MHIFGIERINISSSFCESGAGFSSKRVFSVDLKETLNQSIWETGCQAHNILIAEIDVNYEKLIPEIIKNIDEFIEYVFTPFVLDAYKNGHIDVPDLNGADFGDVWGDQAIEGKYLNMCSMLEILAGHIDLVPVDLGFNHKVMTAALIIKKIDDAALSEFFDGDGLIENIEDIHNLKRHLVLPRSVAAIKRSAVAHRARLNADKRHEKPREARLFVLSEWVRHREAYDHNKSAFTRDYVKRVFNELDVTVTEKQMREVWLRDTPSASKPDGMPAGGE